MIEVAPQTGLVFSHHGIDAFSRYPPGGWVCDVGLLRCGLVCQWIKTFFLMIILCIRYTIDTGGGRGYVRNS